MGLTLLSRASPLPLKYWDHAFTNAIHHINRLPTTVMPTFISPYQALYHKDPSHNNFKTFGHVCFPHLRPFNKHKFQFRSSQCINLGLSANHKGYKCLTSEGKIIISKDVLLNESQFPYPIPFSHNPPPLIIPLPPLSHFPYPHSISSYLSSHLPLTINKHNKTQRASLLDHDDINTRILKGSVTQQ